MANRGQRSTPVALSALERRRTAISLRARGMTWDGVTLQMGYPPHKQEWLRKDTMEWLNTQKRYDVESYRREQEEQYDALIRAHAPVALDAEHPRSQDSAGVVMRAMERKAKLRGLDAPVRIEGDVHDSRPVWLTVAVQQIIGDGQALALAEQLGQLVAGRMAVDARELGPGVEPGEMAPGEAPPLSFPPANGNGSSPERSLDRSDADPPREE